MPFERIVQVDVVQKNATVALRVEGLRVVFQVSKNSKSTPNVARIQIYNMAEKTRAENFKELTDSVILRAGYSDESLDEVFHGNIVSISHPKNDSDIVTTIEANDGQKAARESYSSVSYSEGASLKKVIQDISLQMGLPIKSLDYLNQIPDDKFLYGFTFSGPTKDALDKLTARAGLEWSIQGNQLQILKLGGVVPKGVSQIPVLSPESGLIGSPERRQSASDESPDKKPPGWVIKSLLIGRLEPGGQVGLKCAEVPKPTAFRIESLLHSGDTHGDEFATTCEVLDPGVLISDIAAAA
jgi:hypothetical protein